MPAPGSEREGGVVLSLRFTTHPTCCHAVRLCWCSRADLLQKSTDRLLGRASWAVERQRPSGSRQSTQRLGSHNWRQARQLQTAVRT